MLTKKEAELLVLEPIEVLALKNPAVAIGFLLSGLDKAEEPDSSIGYVPVASLRTLYRTARIEMPDGLKEALRRKEKSFEISKRDTINLAVQAARQMGADSIADGIIAGQRQMPVRRLTTAFPKGSDVERHTAQIAAEKIAYQKKTIAELKAQGAKRIKIAIPTVREVANEFTLHEIFRFASYLKMGQEIDPVRSRITSGNQIYICCTEKFAEALEDARVPGVGKFLQGKYEISGSGTLSKWAPLEKLPILWPFPGSGPKPAN